MFSKYSATCRRARGNNVTMILSVSRGLSSLTLNWLHTRYNDHKYAHVLIELIAYNTFTRLVRIGTNNVELQGSHTTGEVLYAM